MKKSEPLVYLKAGTLASVKGQELADIWPVCQKSQIRVAREE